MILREKQLKIFAYVNKRFISLFSPQRSFVSQIFSSLTFLLNPSEQPVQFLVPSIVATISLSFETQNFSNSLLACRTLTLLIL